MCRQLKRLRKERHLSYRELAKKADIRIDKLNLTEIPLFAGLLTADVVMDLVDYYDIEPDCLFTDFIK